MKRENLLLITPFSSRWLHELTTCLGKTFNVHYLSFADNLNPSDVDQIWAEKLSSRINEIVRAKRIDRVYINYEFAWKLLYDFCVSIDIDRSKLFAILLDDCVYHQENRAVAQRLEISKFIIADPIANLKYKELGFDSWYVPLEGSRNRFFHKSERYAYDLSFYGNLSKADRRQQIEEISGFQAITLSGDVKLGPSYTDLCRFINQSRLNLNLSKSRPDPKGLVRYQFKGRILEIAFCGGLPITESCPGTDLLFGDAVPQFKNAAEVPTIVERLLGHPQELEERRKWVVATSERYRPEDLHGSVH